jgi:hypothetical protein
MVWQPIEATYRRRFRLLTRPTCPPKATSRVTDAGERGIVRQFVTCSFGRR